MTGCWCCQTTPLLDGWIWDESEGNWEQARQFVSCLWCSGSTFISFQFTAQCWYKTETAGSMVFPGSFLLPPSQTLHSWCPGGSRKPSVQQQEDRTYPQSFVSMLTDTARPPKVTCTSVFFILTELQENCQRKQFKSYLRSWGKKVIFLPFVCFCSDKIRQSNVSFLNLGNLEWLDKNKSRCLVMWRRPEEWGKLIYQWVSQSHRRVTTAV